MHVLNSWQVITIGDGDLSFSLALTKRWPDIRLVATVLDSERALRNKYQYNAIDDLIRAGHRVLFNVDITESETFHNRLTCDFDLAIFQFPLVPNAGQRRPGQSWHQSEDSNLLNRKLLRAFLLNSAGYLLSSQGARLCYITSKDVKPYSDWNIECLGERGPLQYFGQLPFHPGDFPGYRIRNVDRDKQVKSTAATTYVWTDKPNQDFPLALLEPQTPDNQTCQLCHIGPVVSHRDWLSHLNSRQHRRRANYQQRWEKYLKHLDDGSSTRI